MTISVPPRRLVFITTYRCTAACDNCCFESSPRLQGQLALGAMTRCIAESTRDFPSIKTVIFTGGECFLLGDDLFSAIRHATQKDLWTRCVTNGYWAATPDRATALAQQLLNAGLNEINISTGDEHLAWVPFNRVIQAANACLDAGITTVLVFEGKETSNQRFDAFLAAPEIINLINKHSTKLKIISNVWVPFIKDTSLTPRVGHARHPQHLHGFKGCDDIFESIVITPHMRVASCCGLTMEHIPEMKIGDISNGQDSIASAYTRQYSDLIKLWLWLDGPEKILEFASNIIGHPYPQDISHPCQACVAVHRNAHLRDALATHASIMTPAILLRANVKAKFNSKAASAHSS